MKKIGLVAWSFGSAPLKDEPTGCNLRLAWAVQEIVERERNSIVCVVAQQEIGRRGISGVAISRVVENPPEGIPNDSEWIMKEAAEVLRRAGVTHVIPVANPFIHRFLCKQLIKKYGFTPLHRRHRFIGFYRQSLTWWTRGPFHLLLYAIRQKLTGYRGDYRPS